MRALLLFSMLSLAAPAVAEDEPTEVTQGLQKADYQKIIGLINAWEKARAADQQIKLQGIDDKLTYWLEAEAEDTTWAPPPEATGKKSKKKGKKSSSKLPIMGDLLDNSVGKDRARLHAVSQELLAMQPRFAQMEANAMHYMEKQRKLKELRELARAEITVPKPPPAKEVATTTPGTSQAPGIAADAAQATGEAAGGPATEAVVEEVEEAAPEEPAGPTIMLLDEDEEPEKKKKKKGKKDK